MGKLYWVTSLDGEENRSCAARIYRDIFKEKENVIFLSAEEIRQTHRDPFDEESTEEAWKQSAQRDMMMIRYLTEQEIDVVYCSSREFHEVREWARNHIPDMEFVTGENGDSSSEAATLPKRSPGTMYWITGLSGAGKTTIGTLLYQKMRRCKKDIVLMDGDLFRDAMHMEQDYSKAGREALSYRNLRLEKLLLECGLDLICCTIAMIENVRQWNRRNLENYIEIYLEVPLCVLEERDSKGLYAGAKKGFIENVVGVNQVAEFPKNPEIKIQNDGTRPPEDVVKEIWEILTETKAFTTLKIMDKHQKNIR